MPAAFFRTDLRFIVRPLVAEVIITLVKQEDGVHGWVFGRPVLFLFSDKGQSFPNSNPQFLCLNQTKL